MVINYQDQNLIVMYLQIYLAEQCGLTVHRVVPRNKKKSDYYEITSNDPLVVTGYYDVPTYTSLALFMAYNYPNEGYPKKWYKDPELGWVSEDYVYQGDQEELISIISNNMELVTENEGITQVPERVLSYIFNEVVTPNSSPEEVLRVKQMVYDFIYAGNGYPDPLSYTEDLFNTIINIQKETINKYTLGYTDKTIEIVMDYERDKNGNLVLDDNEDSIPILTYKIDKQVNEVTAISTEIMKSYTQIGSESITVNVRTNEIKSANVIYEINGVTHEADASSFIKLRNGKWQLNFDESIGNIEQLTVIYVDKEFEYDIVTGDITFFEFTEGKKIEITESINDDINFPIQFEDFKVTGYVDPWTEIILKEGYTDGNS